VALSFVCETIVELKWSWKQQSALFSFAVLVEQVILESWRTVHCENTTVALTMQVWLPQLQSLDASCDHTRPVCSYYITTTTSTI